MKHEELCRCALSPALYNKYLKERSRWCLFFFFFWSVTAGRTIGNLVGIICFPDLFPFLPDYLHVLHKHFWVCDASEVGYKKYIDTSWKNCQLSWEYVVSNVKMFDWLKSTLWGWTAFWAAGRPEVKNVDSQPRGCQTAKNIWEIGSWHPDSCQSKIRYKSLPLCSQSSPEYGSEFV